MQNLQKKLHIYVFLKNQSGGNAAYLCTFASERLNLVKMLHIYAFLNKREKFIENPPYLHIFK